MELTKEQEEIVKSKENKIVVISAPASGKTRVLTERVRYWLDNGVNPKDIACITFTNSAAEEMAQRLGKSAEGAYIGTVHGLANFMLLAGGVNTFKYLDEENFDKLFELVEIHPEVIKHYRYLCIDEVQDTDENQYNFIFHMVNPDNFLAVGDPRQSIYQFMNARPDLFEGLADETGAQVYKLTKNFRNARQILDYAKWILSKKTSYTDFSMGMVPEEGIKVSMDYSLNSILDLVKGTEYGKWFILSRTNSELDTIYDFLKKNGIPVDTFKRSKLGMKALNEKMKSNTVKVLTIHAAKGLENDNVIVVGARWYNEEECRIAYVAATRARKALYWMTQKKKRRF